MIKRHLSYLKYLIKHKYFVWDAMVFLEEGGINLSPKFKLRILLHDLSKCRPSEWIPYARTFYKPDGSNQYEPDESFNKAWLDHIHKNPHHWQHWVLRLDSGDTVALEMPKEIVTEMVLDWAGAGKAITGKWEIREWYKNNKEKMILNETTRTDIETLLDYF